MGMVRKETGMNRSRCVALYSHDTTGMNRSRRVALYSHDTMGLGHARRNLLIAGAPAATPSPPTMLLIAGVREAAAFPLPPGTDHLTLPALGKSADGRYHARTLDLGLSEIVGLRQRTIAAALD